MAVQVTEVQKALKGVDYPADQKELVEHAKRNGADQEVLDVLENMDKETFDGPNAVMKALRGDLGGPTSE
jgi:Protein of unknown function (DUF2795)